LHVNTKQNLNTLLKKFIQNPSDSIVATKILIKENNTKLVITLHQKQKRFYNKVNNYTPQLAKILLCKYNSGIYKFIASQCDNSEKIHIETEPLEKGEYNIFANVNWIYKEAKCSYVISTYSSVQIDLEDLGPEYIPDDYLKQIFADYLMSRGKKEDLGSKDLVVTHSLANNDTGYYMILLKNINIKEEVIFSMEIAYNSDKLKLVSKQQLTNFDKGLNGESSNLVLNLRIPPLIDQMILFELKDVFSNCQLKLDKINYYLNKSDILKDAFKEHIFKNMDKYDCTPISTDLYYYEIPSKDGYLIAIENKSSTSNYILNYRITNIANIEVDNNSGLLNLHPLKFDYVKFKNSSDSDKKPPEFTFEYQYKKMN